MFCREKHERAEALGQCGRSNRSPGAKAPQGQHGGCDRRGAGAAAGAAGSVAGSGAESAAGSGSAGSGGRWARPLFPPAHCPRGGRGAGGRTGRTGRDRDRTGTGRCFFPAPPGQPRPGSRLAAAPPWLSAPSGSSTRWDISAGTGGAPLSHPDIPVWLLAIGHGCPGVTAAPGGTAPCARALPASRRLRGAGSDTHRHTHRHRHRHTENAGHKYTAPRCLNSRNRQALRLQHSTPPTHSSAHMRRPTRVPAHGVQRIPACAVLARTPTRHRRAAGTTCVQPPIHGRALSDRYNSHFFHCTCERTLTHRAGGWDSLHTSGMTEGTTVCRGALCDT